MINPMKCFPSFPHLQQESDWEHFAVNGARLWPEIWRVTDGSDILCPTNSNPNTYTGVSRVIERVLPLTH